MSSHDEMSDISGDPCQSTSTKRRPYRTPTLRKLGSVREVTWGAGSGGEAFIGGMGMKGKGKE